MLSAETDKGNQEATGQASYGRFLYNFYRTYDPSTGRYLEADPAGQRDGTNLFLYAGANPLMATDPAGLAAGGPWHPPIGLSPGCKPWDNCAALKGKLWVFNRMIKSHQGWDWRNPSPRGGGRHAAEIANLWRAYAKCQALYEKKCKCPPPPKHESNPLLEDPPPPSLWLLLLLLLIPGPQPI